MGKKELMIVVVFSIVGFVGGFFIIKAIKGDPKEEQKIEKKKTDKVAPEMEAVNDTLEIRTDIQLR
jgi:large-conductance mechanosensitive channel